MSKRSRILAFGLAGVLVCAGIGGAIAFRGIFGQLLSVVLVGVGLILVIALVFLEVGLSEDRERERERANWKDVVMARERTSTQDAVTAPTGGEEPGAGPAAPEPSSDAHARERLSRPRLDRMRGTRRRLR
jgi:hypothetical protein